jgi:hypothetical protein
MSNFFAPIKEEEIDPAIENFFNQLFQRCNDFLKSAATS